VNGWLWESRDQSICWRRLLVDHRTDTRRSRSCIVVFFDFHVLGRSWISRPNLMINLRLGRAFGASTKLLTRPISARSGRSMISHSQASESSRSLSRGRSQGWQRHLSDSQAERHCRVWSILTCLVELIDSLIWRCHRSFKLGLTLVKVRWRLSLNCVFVGFEG
jgi:hypothetical protein